MTDRSKLLALADETFWSKVDKRSSAECWRWTGWKSKSGYGRYKREAVHRISYIAAGGVIPAGLVMDHLCRTRDCVNPAHLEPVTIGENNRRGINGAILKARNAAITHCPKGHEYTPENTRKDAKGSRSCRTCGRAYGIETTRKRTAASRLARAQAAERAQAEALA